MLAGHLWAGPAQRFGPIRAGEVGDFCSAGWSSASLTLDMWNRLLVLLLLRTWTWTCSALVR